MERSEIERRLSAALEAASRASKFLLSHESLRFSVSDKAENDYVTTADRESENLIREYLMNEFPEDGWFGEETGKSGDRVCRWIVDPIDGTVDFMWSFPLYTVSIAFEDEEGIALGVVAVPRQNEVFHAVRGGGAFLNGKKMEINDNIEIHHSLALLVPPHRVHSHLDEYMVRMRRFYDHFSDMRSLGSAACSLCYVASSRCAVYYEEFLHLYDVAAGILIVREAGGRVSVKENGEYLGILASASSVHETGLELIDGKGSFI